MPYKLTYKIVVLFVVFFVFTYCEDIYIGGVSFASVWKIPIILYFLYFGYFLNFSKLKYFPLAVVGGIFCLKLPLHYNMFNSLTPELVSLFKYIVIPASFLFFIIKYGRRPQKIIRILFWLSIFLIWNNVPYLFGILSPKVQKDYSQAFGEEILDTAGFSGAYMTIHSQGVYMASACLLLIYLMYRYPTRFSLFNIWLIITLSIGIYSLYLSFARTGWLMFAVGLINIFMRDLLDRNRLIKVLPILVVALLGVTYLIQTNDSFRMRLFDERKYSSGNKMEDVGSGRLAMANAALTNWIDSDLTSLFIGYGEEEGKDRMKERIGERLFAHNAFVEVLQTTGIIGSLLFLFFIFLCFKTLKQWLSNISPLAWGFFVGWIFVGAVQEFTLVYLNFYMGAIIALTISVAKKQKYLESKVSEKELHVSF